MIFKGCALRVSPESSCRIFLVVMMFNREGSEQICFTPRLRRHRIGFETARPCGLVRDLMPETLKKSSTVRAGDYWCVTARPESLIRVLPSRILRFDDSFQARFLFLERSRLSSCMTFYMALQNDDWTGGFQLCQKGRARSVGPSGNDRLVSHVTFSQQAIEN